MHMFAFSSYSELLDAQELAEQLVSDAMDPIYEALDQEDEDGWAALRSMIVSRGVYEEVCKEVLQDIVTICAESVEADEERKASQRRGRAGRLSGMQSASMRRSSERNEKKKSTASIDYSLRRLRPRTSGKSRSTNVDTVHAKAIDHSKRMDYYNQYKATRSRPSAEQQAADEKTAVLRKLYGGRQDKKSTDLIDYYLCNLIVRVQFASSIVQVRGRAHAALATYYEPREDFASSAATKRLAPQGAEE
ncbi:hypothetical protein GUITHDRAFT_113763 [Guillardia theta CCMP2712]|uniref:Uncharacterized protein n=1 Tax=Guillardia theta (strain CCMP2712) TaxID=905079 RepID=L1IUT4_GUITC|nr:hypothetical protein GUITHDRAFT_113763 [Guillardia theta CCMP2712]EKX40026.1 hypothetical protein GUITHDRAFT_113763 [Guillardia theta CCMP2712]|eukprot:XP_005827006.1 hypothetical protein GUITHDRAFT_113763 [Guillardia theta CCMP2712]